MRKSFVASLCVLIAAMSFGASVWTGNAGDGKWDTAGNWDPEGAPTETTDVVVTNGNLATTLEISRTQTQKCKSLTVGIDGVETGPVSISSAAKSQTLSVCGRIDVYTDATFGGMSKSTDTVAKNEVNIAPGKTVSWNMSKGSALLYGVLGGAGSALQLSGSSSFAIRSTSSVYTFKDLYINQGCNNIDLQVGSSTAPYRIKNVAIKFASGKTMLQNSNGNGPVKVEGYFCVTNAGTATILGSADNSHMFTVDPDASFTKAGAGVLTFGNGFGVTNAPWVAPATFEEGGVVFNKGAYITDTLTLGSAGKTFTLTKGASGEIKADTLVYNGLTLSGYAVNDVVAKTVKCPANRCQSVKATIDSTTYDYYLYWEKTAGGYNVTLVDHLINPAGLIFIVQ